MAVSHVNDAMAADAMIRRHEKELAEKKTAVNALIANAQNQERDLNDSEKETLGGLQLRMRQIQDQLTTLDELDAVVGETQTRLRQIDTAISDRRRTGEMEVEYRSAGHWALDSYKAALGDRVAQERLEVFYRAAAHQTTADNLGVVPDPVVGSVINFVDSARPLVNLVGPQPMPSSTWHRPVVTQGTVVDVQGTAGAAADEKVELDSQKMTITRLDATAVTYGGYVNVSRQNIDFSSPQILDIIIRDLAARYAIKTEAAFGTELDASTATAVGYGASPTAATIRAALWAAAGDIYSATAGMGRLVLAVSPGRLETFGPLFTPVVGVTQDGGEGLTAGDYSSGLVGNIAGIPVYMSAGLTGTKAFLFSTAAIEAYEQRIGTLQVVEPSVLGVQIAYAGYFTPLTLVDGGIIELTAT